jgi:hypothetical protein
LRYQKLKAAVPGAGLQPSASGMSNLVPRLLYLGRCGFEGNGKLRSAERPDPWFGMPKNRKDSLNKTYKQGAGGRGSQKQHDDKPAVPSGSNLEDTSAASPSSPSEVQVSFFITKAQKAQLREKGYSDDQIAQMKPAEAHRILGLEWSRALPLCSPCSLSVDSRRGNFPGAS